jgi:hypothetical protein
MPKTAEEWLQEAQKYEERWCFPHCLGSVDGKHIRIKKPSNSGSFYFNYKGFNSIVLMCVGSADYQIIMADAGVNGRISDGGVLGYTRFGRLLNDGGLNLPEPSPLPNAQNQDQVPFVFVGDEAFDLTKNFMKPFGLTGRLSLSQHVFNFRLSHARHVIENIFGILVARFGVLRDQIQLEPDKATLVTLACCYLHNFLAKKNPSYLQTTETHSDQTHGTEMQVNPLADQGLQPCVNRNAPQAAKVVRDQFRNYFVSDGDVPWQYNHIRF